MMTDSVKVYAVYFKQDNPKKNTVVRLKKFNLIKIKPKIRFLNPRTLILDPFSEKVLNMDDRDIIEKFGIAVIDCSWNKIKSIFDRKFKTGRRLPPLLAANSTNYGRWNKLNSAEALVASLIITGFYERAKELMSKFSWGDTFIELNHEILRMD